MSAAKRTNASPKMKEEDVPLIVVPRGDAFEVYAADAPKTIYEVSGGAEAAKCSCAEYRWRGRDPEYQCVHISAVLHHLGFPAPTPQTQDPGKPAGGDHASSTDSNYLVLKRSVSSDGRIDSLSVELHATLPSMNPWVVEPVVQELRGCQEGIVQEFLESASVGNDSTRDTSRSVVQPTNGHAPVPAMLREVGGSQTRFGWRYFITVEANGRTSKLFGSRRQLAEHLQAAGHGRLSANISPGAQLNVPCRARLEPSEDGRYVNVVALEPAAVPARNGR